MKVLNYLQKYKKGLVIFLAPILMIPLPVVIPTKEARCAYVIIVTALLWITEALPLAVTGFLPLILFPLLGILKSSQLAMHYFKDATFLYIGVMFIASAIEHWNLHRRIALRMMLLVGSKPLWLMMGFMGTTAFLSMWINNSSTTAMMMPIMEAVVVQLSKTSNSECHASQDQKHSECLEELSENKNDNEMNEMSSSIKEEHEEQSEQECSKNDVKMEEHCSATEKINNFGARQLADQSTSKMATGLSLSIAYAANIGGVATLTGTITNLVLVDQMEERYPKCNCITFGMWMAFSFPCACLFLLIAWLWMAWLFIGFKDIKRSFKGKTNNEKAAEKYIADELKKLGPVSYPESCILFIFILVALLWLTRNPGFMPGWGDLFGENKKLISDTTVAVTIGLTLFFLPSKPPFGLQRKINMPMGFVDDGSKPPPPVLLSWNHFSRNMSWGVCFLIGGGFALAEGAQKSGLSLWISKQLEPLQALPPPLVSIICCLLIAGFTQCTSNLATTTLFLPIIASLSEAIGVNPIYTMLPSTICATFAFMLPVATPPNAIVFAYGRIKVIDMLKSGTMLTVMGILIVALAINTWGKPMFHVDTYPSWASNVTALNQAGST
uniref:Na(+)/citrate cotransporter-like isoform X2 n=1 Tax=Myxine glutinosa TaxID=7769 RepID=UPI00358F519E